MICNIFTSLSTIFSKLLIGDDVVYVKDIVRVLNNNPQLTKKVAMFFIFYYYFNKNIGADYDRKIHYTNILIFTKQMLILKKDT